MTYYKVVPLYGVSKLVRELFVNTTKGEKSIALTLMVFDINSNHVNETINIEIKILSNSLTKGFTIMVKCESDCYILSRVKGCKSGCKSRLSEKVR